MNGSFALDRLTPTLASSLGLLVHLSVKPDRQRTPALERLVVSGPVSRLVGRSTHAPQLAHSIHKMNPLTRSVTELLPVSWTAT